MLTFKLNDVLPSAYEIVANVHITYIHKQMY